MIPHADLVVYGLAENRIEQILRPELWREIPMTDRYILGKSAANDSTASSLDFTLVDGFEDYQPCVEVSRGCGMGCSFCAEAAVPITACLPPEAIADALVRLAATYSGEIRPYFQASFFRPSTRWIEGFRVELKRRGLAIRWRAESRVDGLSPEQVAGLARSGLAVLDLGLESASPRQLLRMKKTRNPSAYLRRASALLEACERNGVWAKVNILLCPGESLETLNETRDWLELHRTRVKGLSVGPMIVFRYGEESSRYLREISALGASAVRSDDLDRIGYAHLNLSPDLPHTAAVASGLGLSRAFMTQGDYFDLKSFSYFPRGFTRLDFDRVVSSIDKASLPFTPD